jgi:hypothetical protein
MVRRPGDPWLNFFKLRYVWCCEVQQNEYIYKSLQAFISLEPLVSYVSQTVGWSLRIQGVQMAGIIANRMTWPGWKSIFAARARELWINGGMNVSYSMMWAYSNFDSVHICMSRCMHVFKPSPVNAWESCFRAAFLYLCFMRFLVFDVCGMCAHPHFQAKNSSFTVGCSICTYIFVYCLLTF